MAMRLWKRENEIFYITFKRGDHRSLKTKDSVLAQKTFNEIEKEYLAGRLRRIEKSELKLFADFIVEYLNVRREKEKNTQRADRLALEKFQQFLGNRPMAHITPKKLDQFRAFLKASGLMESSCNNHIRHLKVALKKAIKWGYLKTNPMEEFKQYKVDKRKPVFMTKEEVKFFINIAGDYCPEMQTAIAVQYYTGMGRAEVTNVMNIGTDVIIYKRVKTKKMISVPIADALRPYIKHLGIGIKKLLPWKNPRTYSKHFAEICKLAGLTGISPHKIRHTFATHLLDAGVDLKTIQELMDHSSIHITSEFYAHLTEGKKKQAVNKLNL